MKHPTHTRLAFSRAFGLGWVPLLAFCVTCAGCGSDGDEHTIAPAAEEPSGHEGHAHAAAEAPAALPSLPEGAGVSFGAPTAGTVSGPLVDGKVVVHVEMQAAELTVMPAGELRDGAGHHHILIDPEGSAGIERGVPVPNDERHLHFGRGQTEADVPLTPGAHVLMLQFADGAHRSYGADLTARVEINVEATPAEAASPGEAAEGATEPATAE